ncbi:NLI interacting factor-like phosphatase, putative [Plasmodium ovale wallikeri]|uniref:NLI interacting factor-like phosphatase, putative n=1 Tax=Plasmodium ovale wallikeri TaxID=864142 RepID=A0A1A8YYD1_PLAOA|nr:NLI interacting factor-like phosphatase, putative [Plasmodium ovale wallikeri]SBT36726.1 NLI interacting factor-like phosphatase, putative [Plasmodium ovale wallikeri]
MSCPLCPKVKTHQYEKEKDRKIKRRICPSMTLVLDLDETLIYCTKKKKFKYQKEVDVLINGKYLSLYVCKRPYIDLFFSVLYPFYEIVIFTTSIKSYADTVLNIIDVDHYIDKKFYREDCYEINKKIYIKNLLNIKKEISKIILIDDTNISSVKYPDNFFQIKKWQGDLNDTELLDIIPFFLNLRKVRDIRSICSFRSKSQKDISKLFFNVPDKQIKYFTHNNLTCLYSNSFAFQAINYLKIFMNKFRYASKKKQWNELGKKINNKLKSYPYSLSKLKGSSDDEEEERRRTLKKIVKRGLHHRMLFYQCKALKLDTGTHTRYDPAPIRKANFLF